MGQCREKRGGITALSASRGRLDVNIRLNQSKRRGVCKNEKHTYSTHTYTHASSPPWSVGVYLRVRSHHNNREAPASSAVQGSYLPVRKQLVMGSVGEMVSSLWRHRRRGKLGQYEKEKKRQVEVQHWKCSVCLGNVNTPNTFRQGARGLRVVKQNIIWGNNL